MNKRLSAQVDPGSVTDDTLSAYATVEVVDLEGDIIRVDGCDLSLHEIEPIKIFPDHTYLNEVSGEPTVIGKVLHVEKTVWKDGATPAIRFDMKWADNNLAKSYRDLYRDGFMSGFSMGVIPIDGKKIDNGVDWTKTRLTEISCASIPANQYANVIKSFQKYGIQFRRKNMSEPQGLTNIGVAGEGFTRKDMDEVMGMHMGKCMKDFDGMVESRIGKVGEHLTAHHKSMCEHVDRCFKSLHERLDGIEADLAVSQDGPDGVYKSAEMLSKIEAQKKIDEIRAAFDKAAASMKS